MDHLITERERERDTYIHIVLEFQQWKLFLRVWRRSLAVTSTLWPIEFSYAKLGRSWEIWKRVSTKAASKIRVEPGRAYTVVNEKRHCFVPRFSVVPPISLPLPLDFNESFDELADSDAQREYRFLEFVKLSSWRGGGGRFRWLFTSGEKKVVGGGRAANSTGNLG